METLVGKIMLVADEQGLRKVMFEPRAEPDWQESETPFLRDAKRQIEQYFADKRREFDLILAPEGTDFQKAVWAELRKIPYGEVICYGQLAARVGRPKGSQAVGQANKKNSLPIVIPCHRVINADGKIGGFACGPKRKQTLLEIEDIEFGPNGKVLVS